MWSSFWPIVPFLEKKGHGLEQTGEKVGVSQELGEGGTQISQATAMLPMRHTRSQTVKATRKKTETSLGDVGGLDPRTELLLLSDSQPNSLGGTL